MRKQTLAVLSALTAVTLLGVSSANAQNTKNISFTERARVEVKDNSYPSKRPDEAARLFRSKAVEAEIDRVSKLLKNPKLRWMFRNTYPNTIDTTVHFRYDKDGKPETFVYTGDLSAMWLRDSGAQVWPYLHLANEDPKLKDMLKGVIRMQMVQIVRDPFANAFYDSPDEVSDWAEDMTRMLPGVHERKWEIDSLCYPLRLAYEYWKITGDASIFDDTFYDALKAIMATLKDQQRKEGKGAYSFQRVTGRASDTKTNDGFGEPVNPVGLIVSAFRPSDDATHFQFLVPSNFFAVTSCRKAAEMAEKGYKDTALANEYRTLADEVEAALHKYATTEHPKYGMVYAFETDGFGNHYFMDDANVPSLLAMPYLGDLPANDEVYQNTRRLILSEDNPYFFRSERFEGIGGPHIGYDYIWPMSIMMRAFTSTDDAEIKHCIEMLLASDADTGLIHESFHKDDPKNYTRAWFAWQNGLFGELILKLVKEGKVDLLNSIK